MNFQIMHFCSDIHILVMTSTKDTLKVLTLNCVSCSLKQQVAGRVSTHLDKKLSMKNV